MKKEGWTMNQFIRRVTLMSLIHMLIIYAPEPMSVVVRIPALLSTFQTKEDLEMLRESAKELEVLLSPEKKQEVLRFVNMLNDSLIAFNNHAPRGRPKNPRSRRGRKADKGTDIKNRILE